MTLFEQVKECVTARQAAEHYGIKVKRNGMACCPFHKDRHPSMKADKMYHCFACGVGGDAIDFTARLFGLSQYEAAKKLVEFYKPEPEEEWHELFTEALANERKINDYLDVLMFGTGEEIVEFFKMKRREVEKIEERINEYQREVLDGIRRYCERGDAYNRRCQ